MKKYVYRFCSLLLLAIVLGGCASVPPGKVGILVNATGSKRGVSPTPLMPGRYSINPINQDVYYFPTSKQVVNWTKSPQEGSPVDESMTFNSMEGESINVDVSLGFSIDPKKAPALFAKYNKPIEQIIAVDMRSAVRDSLMRNASSLPIVKIYGESKSKLLDAAKEALIKKVGDMGFIVEELQFISDMRLAPRIQESITASIAATNEAVAAENQVRKSKALAQQKIEEARGQAESNRLLQQSASETSIRWQQVQNQRDAIAKWDGKLPTVTSGGTPFISVPNSQ